jgi:hypothetical protein
MGDTQLSVDVLRLRDEGWLLPVSLGLPAPRARATRRVEAPGLEAILDAMKVIIL